MDVRDGTHSVLGIDDSQGSGFSVSGLGSRVWDGTHRVLGIDGSGRDTRCTSWFRVKGLGFRV
jgi:hypothetical protein